MIKTAPRIPIDKDIPTAALSTWPVGKMIAHSEWSGKSWTLVHDGKYIVVLHGPEAITGTGNSKHTMLCGTESELRAKVKRLGLISPEDEPVETATIEPKPKVIK